MARILWIACAEPGSLFPAVPIALELARRGHEVTALSAPEARETFASLGLGFRPETELARHLAGFDASAHEHPVRAWHAGYVRALFADASRELAGSYDAVLADPLEPGGLFAAEAAGLPSCSYAHWRPDETGIDTWFRFRVRDRERPGAEAFVEWWNEQRALVGLGPEPRPRGQHLWYRHSPDLALVLGLPELAEPKGELPPYVVRVGPTTWEPPADAPAWLEEIGRDRPAVLASVSTVGGADAELLAAVAAAAEDEPLDVVATVPGGGDLPPLPTNVRLVPFVPHGLLLPRAAAVVSHGGNGTVTRAAAAGVPLLLLPHGKDQPDVARGAAAAGVAIVLDRTRLDARETRRALRALVGDVGYRERARELARRAAAYDAPGTAADAFEQALRSAA